MFSHSPAVDVSPGISRLRESYCLSEISILGDSRAPYLTPALLSIFWQEVLQHSQKRGLSHLSYEGIIDTWSMADIILIAAKTSRIQAWDIEMDETYHLPSGSFSQPSRGQGVSGNKTNKPIVLFVLGNA